MASNAERVLAGILNKESPRRDLLGYAILRLDADHFHTDALKAIYKLLVRYYDRTGSVMPQEIFTDTMQSSGIEAAKILAVTRTYESLVEMPVPEDAFKWSVDALIDERANYQTGVAFTEGVEILERGYEDPKGNYYKGGSEARAYVLDKLGQIDKTTVGNDAPEGDVFVEHEALWQQYVDRKSGLVEPGIKTGIPDVDSRIAGWAKGDFILVVGYANAGKTHVVTQAAWDCAVNQGKNAFVATTETIRNSVMRRFLARHSMLSIFDHPIDATDIKRGTLTPSGEKVLADVLEDWRYNTSYGKLNVVQMPSGATTLSYMENRLREYSRENEVSLLVADYLALFKAETKRANEREEFNEILRRSKGIAQGFNDGDGIAFVSPWQVNRSGNDSAQRSGRLNLASMSDTSEAAKSPDQVIAIMRDEEETRQMSIQFLKMRDEDFPPILPVSIDFRYSYIGTRAGSATLSSSGVDSNLMSQLDGLT